MKVDAKKAKIEVILSLDEDEAIMLAQIVGEKGASLKVKGAAEFSTSFYIAICEELRRFNVVVPHILGMTSAPDPGPNDDPVAGKKPKFV